MGEEADIIYHFVGEMVCYLLNNPSFENKEREVVEALDIVMKVKQPNRLTYDLVNQLQNELINGVRFHSISRLNLHY